MLSRQVKWIGAALAVAIGVAGCTTIKPAKAADLGGSCCEDLEARVAEMEATVAKHGNRKMELTISGVIDYAFLNETNNFAGPSGTSLIQNANDPTRLEIEAVGTATKDIRVGGVIEMGINPDAAVVMGVPGNTVSARQVYVFVDIKGLKASVGTIDQTTKGLEELGAVDVSMVAPMLDITTVGQAFSSVLPPTFNGELFGGARVDGAKVEWTPIDGLTIGGSYAGSFTAGGTGVKDVSAKFHQIIAKEVAITADAGYRDDNNGNTFILASAGLMDITTGLFVQGGYAEARGGATVMPTYFGTGKGWQVQGGVSKALFGPVAGVTTAYIEYGQIAPDAIATKPDLYGLGIVQQVGNTSTDVYLGGRRYDDHAGNQITSILGGVSVHF